MKKPKCQLTGENGNVFNLLGLAKKVLQAEGTEKESREMLDKAYAAKSYQEALAIINEYVEVE